MADRVAVTVDGGVADVRLTRPDKMNALDAAMVEAIVAAGEQVGDDPSVRAVVLSGEGRGFCAGLDFAAFGSMVDNGDDAVAGLGTIARLAQRVVRVWAELPVPVIAAIHGPALGGGLQLALGADIRIVAPDAKLGALGDPLGDRSRHDRHAGAARARRPRSREGSRAHRSHGHGGGSARARSRDPAERRSAPRRSRAGARDRDDEPARGPARQGACSTSPAP